MEHEHRDSELEAAQIALRIVADIARLVELTGEHPNLRIQCGPNLVRAGENLWVSVDQAARLGGSAEIGRMLEESRQKGLPF